MGIMVVREENLDCGWRPSGTAREADKIRSHHVFLQLRPEMIS